MPTAAAYVSCPGPGGGPRRVSKRRRPNRPPVPEVLKPLLRETPKPRYGVPVPKRISGRVERKSNGSTTGVAGVSVTDGYSVVKTDRQGRFSIVPDPSAVFLYLTRPSGHDVVGNWYKPLSAESRFCDQAGRSRRERIHVHPCHRHARLPEPPLAGRPEPIRQGSQRPVTRAAIRRQQR